MNEKTESGPAITRSAATEALRKALDDNNLSAARRAIDQGADPYVVDDLGRTVLHLAAQMGTPETIDWAVAAGADPDARDGAGLTPLMTAVDHDRSDAVSALLAAGADPLLEDVEGRAAVDRSPLTPPRTPRKP